MKRSIYIKIITVVVAVLLCTACGGDKSDQTFVTAEIDMEHNNKSEPWISSGYDLRKK